MRSSSDSFSDAYIAWLDGGRGHDRTVEPELANTYRSAWASGEGALVLNFIMLRPHPEGFDLMIEGLCSDDPELAETAAANAGVLISQGFELGPTVRDAFQTFGDRFPHLEVLRWAALRALDRAEGRGAG